MPSEPFGRRSAAFKSLYVLAEPEEVVTARWFLVAAVAAVAFSGCLSLRATVIVVNQSTETLTVSVSLFQFPQDKFVDQESRTLAHDTIQAFEFGNVGGGQYRIRVGTSLGISNETTMLLAGSGLHDSAAVWAYVLPGEVGFARAASADGNPA